MRLLLDTQITLWALTGSARLGATARGLIADPANDIYVSAASIREIAIKHSFGRGDMPVSGARAVELCAAAGYRELPCDGSTPPWLKSCRRCMPIPSTAFSSPRRWRNPCACCRVTLPWRVMARW